MESKFAIIKNCDNQKIIDFVDSVDEFINKIKSVHTIIYDMKYDQLYDNKNNKYECGLYLLIDKNNREVKEIELKMNIKKGYIYNTIEKEINVLNEWKIIPIKKEKYSIKLNKLNKLRKLNKLDKYPNVNIVGNYIKYNKLKKVFDLFINSLFEKKRNILIMCQKEKYYFYKNKFKNAKIIIGFNSDKLDNYVHNNFKNGIIIFDDVLNNEWTNNGTLIEMLYHGKYYKKTIITISNDLIYQKYLKLPFDYVFIEHLYGNKLINYCNEQFNCCDEKFINEQFKNEHELMETIKYYLNKKKYIVKNKSNKYLYY